MIEVSINGSTYRVDPLRAEYPVLPDSARRVIASTLRAGADLIDPAVEDDGV